MRKFILGAALVLAALLLPATPAMAQSSPRHCDNEPGYGITICLEVFYGIQNDGDGVRVDHITIDIDHGCNEMEDHPINVMGLASYDHDGLIRDTIPIDDMNDCHAYRTVTNFHENDHQETIIQWWGRVRVNLNPDYNVNYQCTLRPSNPDDCQTND